MVKTNEIFDTSFLTSVLAIPLFVSATQMISSAYVMFLEARRTHEYVTFAHAVPAANKCFVGGNDTSDPVGIPGQLTYNICSKTAH